MKRLKRKIIDLCYSCNIYKDECSGSQFEWNKAGYDCEHRVSHPHSPESKIQVHAFHSLYKAKINSGTDMLNSFAEAIVQSSDDAFAIAKVKNPHLIKLLKSGNKRKY